MGTIPRTNGPDQSGNDHALDFVFGVSRLLAAAAPEDEMFLDVEGLRLASGPSYCFGEWVSERMHARLPVLLRGLGIVHGDLEVLASVWRRVLNCQGGISVSILLEEGRQRPGIKDGLLSRWQSNLLERLRNSCAQPINEHEHWPALRPLLEAWPRAILDSAQWRLLPTLFPGRSIELDDVWVELQLSDTEEPDEEALCTSVTMFFERFEGSAVITGPPGSGKTTLLRWLARRMINLESGQFLLPFFVPLRSYAAHIQANRERSLVSFALYTAGCRTPQLVDYWRDLISVLAYTDRGTVLFLLDGLDEVPDACRNDVLDDIKALGTDHAFALTSRPGVGGLSVAADKYVRMAPLRPEGTHELIRRWFAASGVPGVADRLIAWLDRFPSLAQMAANPFLLTLICGTSESRGRGTAGLPRSRTQVYQRTMDAIRTHHNAHLTHARPMSPQTDRALDALSLWLLADAPDSPRYLFTAEEVGTTTGNQHFFDDILRPSRLIMATSPDGSDHAFLHTTLQEYFAARGLAGDTEKLTEVVTPHAHQQAWSEVLRFLAGLPSAAGLWSVLKERAQRLDRTGLLALRLSSCVVEACRQLPGAEPDGGKSLLGQDLRPALWSGIQRGVASTTFAEAYYALDPADLLEHLDEAIASAFPDVRARLTRIRRGIRGPENSLALVRALLEGDETLAAVAAYQAGSLDSVGLAILRDAAASNPSTTRRRFAVRALGLARDGGAVELLLSRTGVAEDEDEAAEAIQALGRIGNLPAVRGLVKLWTAVSEPLLVAVISALGHSREPEARDHLLFRLATLEPGERWVVDILEALADWPIREGAELIMEFLRDHKVDPEIREAAAAVLGGVRGREVGVLTTAFSSDPDARVRRAAARSLANAASDLELVILLHHAEHVEDDELAGEALRSAILGATRSSGGDLASDLSDTVAIVAKRLLRSGGRCARWEVAAQGWRLGARLAPELLELATKVESAGIREMAVRSLGHLRWQPAVPLLRALIEAAPDASYLEERPLGERSEHRLARAAAWALTRIAPAELLDLDGNVAECALTEFGMTTGSLVYSDCIVGPTAPWPFDAVLAVRQQCGDDVKAPPVVDLVGRHEPSDLRPCVFLAYDGKVERLAAELAKLLRRHVSIHFHPISRRLDQPWPDTLREAQASSRATIVVLPPEGPPSSWLMEEILEGNRLSSSGHWLVTVLPPGRSTADLPPGLRRWEAMQWEAGGPERIVAEVLAALERGGRADLDAGGSKGVNTDAGHAAPGENGLQGLVGRRRSPYRMQLISDLESHLPPAFDRSFPLDTLFIRPTFRKQTFVRNYPSPYRTMHQGGEEIEHDNRLRSPTSSSELITLGQLRKQVRSVIIGSPGSGKSILCRFMALQSARYGGGRLPIIIRVRNLKPNEWAGGMSLADFLVTHLRDRAIFNEEALDEVRTALHCRRATIFVDGLDEAGPELRPTLLGLLDALYANPPGSVLATARSSGFVKTSEFRDAAIVSLDGLSPSGSERLARALLGARLPAFVHVLSHLPETEELVRSPLLLTLLASLFLYRGSQGIPERRASLYRQLIAELVERWIERDGKRSVETSDDPMLIRSWLRRLAFCVHKSGSEQFSKDDARLAWLEVGGRGPVEGRLKLNGILDAAGEDRFQFVHRSLRELLTAERFLELGNEGLNAMRRTPWTPPWEQVVHFAAGLTADEQASREFALTSGQLIEAIRDGGETVVHHRLLTVGRLLHELGSEQKLSPALAGMRREVDRDLLQLLDDPLDISAYGLRVAEAGGSAVAGHLLTELDGEQPLMALHYLGSCREVPSAVMDRALAWLEHSDELFRQSAIEFLTTRRELFDDDKRGDRIWTGTEDDDTASRIVRMLDDPSADVRSAALDFLALSPGLSKSAMERAIRCLLDSDQDVRLGASLFIESRGALSDHLLSVLLQYIQDEGEEIREEAVGALAELVPLPEWVQHILVSWLEYGDTQRRVYAFDAMSEHQELSENILRRLTALISNSEEEQRECGVELLHEFDVLPDSIIDELFRILEDPATVMQSKQRALQVLGSRDFLSDAYQIRLVEALGAIDKKLRERLILVVRSRVELSRPNFRKLAELLDHEKEELRLAALKVANGKELPSWLLIRVQRMLTESASLLRAKALQVLGASGEWSPDFDEMAIDLLEDSNPATRLVIAVAAGDRAELSRRLLTKLETLLNDRMVRIRIAAIAALVKQNPIPESVKTFHRQSLNASPVQQLLAAEASGTELEQSDDETVRLMAAIQWTIAGWRGLSPIKEEVVPALKGLLTCTVQKAFRSYVVAITRFQNPDMPGSLVQAAQQLPELLSGVITWLREYKALSESTLLWVLDATGHSDDTVRGAATGLLRERESLSAGMLGAVVDRLSSENSPEREAALTILRDYGPLDEVLVTRVRALMDHQNAAVRKAAIVLLGDQSVLNSTMIVRMLAALGDGEFSVREQARAFPWARHVSEWLLQMLVQMLKIDSEELRAGAVEVLWKLEERPRSPSFTDDWS